MTYEVALILTVDADSPTEAAETAYCWCTDTELESPTLLVLPALADGFGGMLFDQVEALPNVIRVSLSESEHTP
jgi:hypothetical protein